MTANTNANNSSHQDQAPKKQAVAVTTPPTGMCWMIFLSPVAINHFLIYFLWPGKAKKKLDKSAKKERHQKKVIFFF